MNIALRLGPEKFWNYMQQFGMMKKTGVDLPGESNIIIHKKENIGNLELATMSFGQSFQITPIQLVTTAASIVNGGYRITPHFGIEVRDEHGMIVETLEYEKGERILSAETSEKMRYALEMVVKEGGGKNGQVEGYAVGGKTATSQTLPRSANRYISSFLGFAPADDPVIMGICIIYNPKGVYYGGTIAAPVIQKIFENILPYLNVDVVSE